MTFQNQSVHCTINCPWHKQVRNILKLLPKNSNIINDGSQDRSILLLRVQFLTSSQRVTFQQNPLPPQLSHKKYGPLTRSRFRNHRVHHIARRGDAKVDAA
ncbi:hypothetical protein ERO13_A03G075200v2 [Gossypium hirsutum]|nr:hypothetical protein ERO13_A03G075200v2 [Gossypium hirsutum]